MRYLSVLTLLSWCLSVVQWVFLHALASQLYWNMAVLRWKWSLAIKTVWFAPDWKLWTSVWIFPTAYIYIYSVLAEVLYREEPFNIVVTPFTGANLNGNEAHCYQLQAPSVLSAQSMAAPACLVILYLNICVSFYFSTEKEKTEIWVSLICSSNTNYANYYGI